MPHVLHVIEYLDKGGATRAALATAKYSSKIGPFEHSIVSLKPASPEALELAKESNIHVYESPSITHLDSLIDDADIVQIEYWNAPAINKFLHTSLPPHRLAIWFHVAGFSPPQVIHQELFNLADVAIAVTPRTLDEHPVFQSSEEPIDASKRALVIAPTDFDRLRNIELKQHEGFNVGYIGTVDFVKMHREFIPMSARIEVPEAKFIVCGDGIQNELLEQARALHAEDRFDFRGYVEDIASVIEILDVYGYPLCEDTYAAAELVLQEVMYAGVPPIAFPHGGIKGLIQHNRTGLIVTSAEDYRRAIEYLYYNPVEKKRLGVNAAAYARAHFGARNAARSMNSVYEQLLQTPKQYHIWGEGIQAYSPHLSQQPSQSLESSDLFIASMGDYGQPFNVSKTEKEIQSLLSADKEIAQVSYLVYKTGLFRYMLDTPSDPYLCLWSGLYLEQNNMLTEALSAYAGAISSNFSDWRAQWYFARTLKKQGKEEEAQRVYEALRNAVPSFDEITQDSSYTSPKSDVISFTTQAPLVENENAGSSAKKIRVSALVSTYNAESFIDGCLYDLISQSLYKEGELEIIVIDACSEENEKDVVEGYQGYYDNIVYVRTEKRETLYASWNRAIKLAKGRYLTSANTDDRHRNDALELMADYLDDNLDIALIYPAQIDTSVPNEQFDSTTSSTVLDWPTYSYEELERHCIIGSQPMWRRSLHDHYGMFRDSFVSAGDYEFWLRVGKHETFYKYPEVIGLYYRNPKGIEHGGQKSKEEAIQIWKEYGMFDRGIPVILNGQIITSPDQLAPSTQPETASSLSVAPSFDILINDFEEQLIGQRFDKALQIGEEAIRYYPDLPYSYILKAIALRQKEEYSTALLTLEKSIQLEETPEALIELIQLSIATENLEEARKTEAYILYNYPEWATRLASISLPEVNEESSVLKELTKPAGLDDLEYTVKSFDDLKTEFERYLRHSDVQNAEVLALAATRKFPENYESWVLRATSFRLQGSYSEAKKAIQQSLLIQDSAEALIELLELSLSTGDYDEASQIARAIKESYPDFQDHISALLGQYTGSKQNSASSSSTDKTSRSLELATSKQEPQINTLSSKDIILQPAIKNFMPLDPLKINSFRGDDIFLVSYPGSGSSWLCNLLADIFQQTKGYATSADHLPIPTKQIIPDLHHDDMKAPWLNEHGFQQRIFRTFDIANVTDHSIIYLFRDPLEALISAYHYYKQEPSLRDRAHMSCDLFCSSNIEQYNQHVNAALMLKEAAPDRVLLIDFKRLDDQTSKSLQRVLEYIVLDVNASVRERAIENRDIDRYLNIKQYENTVSSSPGFDFLQPGNELTRITVEQIVSTLMPVYQEACRVAESDSTDQSSSPLLTPLPVGHFV